MNNEVNLLLVFQIPMKLEKDKLALRGDFYFIKWRRTCYCCFGTTNQTKKILAQLLFLLSKAKFKIRVDFTKQKDIPVQHSQKFCHLISLTIETANFKLKFVYQLPNAKRSVRPILYLQRHSCWWNGIPVSILPNFVLTFFPILAIKLECL